ncbi:hypothetical protein [Collimonas sp.]|uniref:hypothetical protein n=1 Tax=Collimonas sp. TaxID=1963772 RepID=UPI002C95500D|nr:hypothetical protein [Collimonas sp.]HWX02495.1 hypothetical protein [Collimonas sp.]
MDDKSSCEMLVQLLLAKTKRDLDKLCRKSVITLGAFHQVIEGCEMRALPWIHHISYRDFIPAHLRYTPDNIKSLFPQILKQRRYLVGHIFYLQDHSNWHFFYFDQRDLDHKNNHFKNGPHIHLVNHLWPQHSAESIWQQFNDGNPVMKGAFHICFEREINDPEKIFN